MSFPDWVPIRPELRDEEPYGAPQMEGLTSLNVNENPYAPSNAVIDSICVAVREVAASLNRYPDREATVLRSALADYLGYGLTADQVWAANGSNEVMMHIMGAFAGPERSIMSFTPTYSMYPEYARDSHSRWVEMARTETFDIDTDLAVAQIAEVQPDVVVLTSPNNPTGTALRLETLEAILNVAPGIVVVDEAYAEFRRTGTPSALELLADHRRLVVTRTLSKAFALAGARLGYVAAHREIIDALRIVRLPYHLSAVTQAVATAALSHSEELLAQVDSLRQTRDELASWLTDQGYEVAASDANFVMFGRFADRDAIWQGLVDRGILIRQVGPAGWLRVSVGTPAEMMDFKHALSEVDPK